MGIEFVCDYHVVFDVGDVSETFQEHRPMAGIVSLVIDPYLPDTLELLTAAAVDLVPYVPPEEVVYFRVGSGPAPMAGIYARLPNLNALRLMDAKLSDVFPEPNPDKDEVLFPCLQHLHFQNLKTSPGDWSPLINFLAGRAASGNQLSTLTISRCEYIPSNVEDTIRELVHDFEVHDAGAVFVRGNAPTPSF